MTSIVLSASFPEKGDRGSNFAPYFPADIASAVAAVAEASLRSGLEFRFGAHPTISPIVLQVAELLEAGRQVHIYQSAFFDDVTTDDVARLVTERGAHFHSTKSASDKGRSLETMRRIMLGGKPRAAFFCGGMDGIRDEYRMADEMGVPRYLLPTPGGMTAILARQARLDELEGSRPTVLEGRAYGSLVLEALEKLGLDGPQASGPFEAMMYVDPEESDPR